MDNSYIIAILVIINAVNFLLYGFDKYRAIKNAWRIPESTFFLFGILGGGVGGLLGMQFFRHKTKKNIFYIVNLIGTYLIYRYLQ